MHEAAGRHPHALRLFLDIVVAPLRFTAPPASRRLANVDPRRCRSSRRIEQCDVLALQQHLRAGAFVCRLADDVLHTATVRQRQCRHRHADAPAATVPPSTARSRRACCALQAAFAPGCFGSHRYRCGLQRSAFFCIHRLDTRRALADARCRAAGSRSRTFRGARRRFANGAALCQPVPCTRLSSASRRAVSHRGLLRPKQVGPRCRRRGHQLHFDWPTRGVAACATRSSLVRSTHAIDHRRADARHLTTPRSLTRRGWMASPDVNRH